MRLGIRRVSVPDRATKSSERRRDQKKRWFKRAQKWRTGREGRISLLKRRHGLTLGAPLRVAAEVEEDPADEVIQYGRDQTERQSENGCFEIYKLMG